MPLHRLTVPTYNGGLPGTHDYINDPPANGDPGAAAPADTKKSSGVNEGTYFVAFGEPARASNVNRISQALSENTDFLDDIVHADQSIPTVTSSVTPGAPVASVVIVGDVFVGDVGETDDQRTRSGLVAVLDGDGIPLHILSGGVYVPILVTDINDGGPTLVGSGYYTNPTVEFTPSIPAGQSYRLVHYVRGNLKTQPTSTYTRLADGVRGEEDLWALAKTTLSGIATFDGVKTFNDQFVRGIANPETPSIDALVGSDALILASRLQVTGTPDVRSRIYHGRYDDSEQGLFFTYNAVWDDANSWWEGDSTATGAMSLVVAHDGVRIFGIAPTLPTDWGGASGNTWDVLFQFYNDGSASMPGDVGIDGDFTYNTPPTRVVRVPIEVGQTLSGQWQFVSTANGAVWRSLTNDGEVHFSLNRIIPAGATITQIRAVVDNIDADASNTRFILFTKGITFSPSVAAPTTISTAAAAGTGVVVVTMGSLSQVVSESVELSVAVLASEDGSANQDLLYSLEVTYTDPGPRNY